MGRLASDVLMSCEGDLDEESCGRMRQTHLTKLGLLSGSWLRFLRVEPDTFGDNAGENMGEDDPLRGVGVVGHRQTVLDANLCVCAD